MEFIPSSFNLWLESNIRLRCAMLFSSFPLRPGGYVRFNVPARTYELAFPSSEVHYLAGRNRKRFRQRRATRAGTSFATNLRSVRRTGEGVFRTELPMISFFPLDEGRESVFSTQVPWNLFLRFTTNHQTRDGHMPWLPNWRHQRKQEPTLRRE